MNVQSFREALRPHLPTRQEPSGVPVDRMAQGCQSYIDAVAAGQEAPHPYPSEMATPDRLALSADLKQLASGTQADFAEKLGDPGAVLRLPGLQTSVESLGTEQAAQVERLTEARSSCKSAYNRQVVKTVAWMGATAGTLVLGGMLPNPVTGLLIAGAVAMTVRSLSKARAAHKELVKHLPQIEANLRASRELLGAATFYAPHLAGWNDLLGSGAGSQPAAA